jgi:hypothetical protein
MMAEKQMSQDIKIHQINIATYHSSAVRETSLSRYLSQGQTGTVFLPISHTLDMPEKWGCIRYNCES